MKMDLGLMRALNQVITRSGLAQAMGFGHNGTRDYYTTFGYRRTLTFQDMMAKYLRQGIASRIVDAPAQSLWDNPPIVTSSDSEWNQAWERIVTKHGLWETILRADKLAGIGRYSCVLIGVHGLNNLEMQTRALPTGAKPREILYFQVYSQDSADITKLNAEPGSTNYMRPEYYTLYPFKQQENGVLAAVQMSVPSMKAHASRILHIAENTLENPIYGSPRLERVFNDLEDMMKVTGGTAEIFWLTANRGMQVDIDKEMELSPEDAEDLSAELDEYQNQLRRVIRTRGVKITNLGSDAPDPSATFDMQISLISGTSGIPRRILIGAEAGQLASEQDRANWAERIKARRTEFGEPVVLIPLISQLTQLGCLPSRPDIQITIDWPDAYQLSPLELAQKAAQHARSATNFAGAIDKLVKLKQGTPATTEAMDAEGNPIPGSGNPGVVGEDYTDIISVEWMKDMLGQKPKKPQFDDPGDLNMPTKG